MVSSFSSAWLSNVAEPLTSKFGGDLTVCRDGNAVRWGFAGQSALVEMLSDGQMHAIFIDRESVDSVSRRPAAAVYRARVSYALTEASCGRMVTDMVDFFSGMREPKFRFVDAHSR